MCGQAEVQFGANSTLWLIETAGYRDTGTSPTKKICQGSFNKKISCLIKETALK